MKDEIIRYILMPYAIKYLGETKGDFKQHKFEGLYVVRTEKTIKRIQDDYNDLRKKIIGQYKARVKIIEKDVVYRLYSVDIKGSKKEIKFTNKEIQDGVSDLLMEYWPTTEVTQDDLFKWNRKNYG